MSVVLPINPSTRGPEQYTAIAGQTLFPGQYPLQAAGDVAVWTSESSGESWTLQTLGTDYEVLDVGSETGFHVRFLSPLAAGVLVRHKGLAAIENTTDFAQGNVVKARGLNDKIDRLTIYAQEARRDLDTLASLQEAADTIDVLVPQVVASANAAAAAATAAAAALATIETQYPAIVNDDGHVGLGVVPSSDVMLAVATSSSKRGIKIDHYAAEVGQYALDIHCFKNAGATDANSGICIHNYSADFPAMIIDSTDQQTLLSLNNSENAVTSPGTRGTGPFISFSGYAGDEPTTRRNLGYLNGQLQFATNYDDVLWTFATGLVCTANALMNNRALTVQAANTGYAAQIFGQDGGLYIGTEDDGLNSFAVVKSGAGAGTVAILVNGGVGDTLNLTDGALATKLSVNALGILDSRADTLRLRTDRTPASASAAGAAGELCADANYIYRCVGIDTWKRAALSTW